jgi:hypothetical protein
MGRIRKPQSKKFQSHADKIEADKLKKRSKKKRKKIESFESETTSIDRIIQWEFYRIKTNKGNYLYAVGGPNNQLHYFNTTTNSNIIAGEVPIVPSKDIYSLSVISLKSFIDYYTKTSKFIHKAKPYSGYADRRLKTFINYIGSMNSNIFNNLKGKRKIPTEEEKEAKIRKKTDGKKRVFSKQFPCYST